MRLFSYKMTYDTGFAPNPFHGVLTLATCKPEIRRTKKEGDWVVGFSSKELHNNARQMPYGVDISEEALIWLGQVSEVVPISEYFNNRRFLDKIPDYKSGDPARHVGDNIYKPSSSCGYKQLESEHGPNDQEHDLNGENVLVFERFYYLGRKGLPIPDFGISRPTNQTRYGNLTSDETTLCNLIEWIDKNYGGQGVLGMPCMMTLEGSGQSQDCDGCGA